MALTANFIADFSSFTDATKDAVTAMQGFKESALEMGTAADRSLEERQKQAEQIGRAVRRVAQDALEAGKTFIDAYAEEQEAVQRLNTALAETGNATPAVMQAYQDMAAEFQKTTRYADDAIINVTAVLTTIGHVGPEQMKLALDATTGLASALKIDLNTAATMVAKSIQEGHEPVRKLKDLLGDTYQPGMKASEVLQLIRDKTSGAAQDDLKTYNGQIDHLKNALGDVNEQAGKLLVDTLNSLLSVFQALPEGVQKFAIIVGTIGTALAPVLISLASLITILSQTGLGAALSAAATYVGGLIASFAALVGWPALIVAAIVALAAAIYYNWESIKTWTRQLYEGVKYWLVDQFTGLVDRIKGITAYIVGIFRSMYQSVVGGSIVPDLIAGIGDQFAQLDRLMVDPVRDATAAATKSFASLTGASVPAFALGASGGLLGGDAAGATVINISMTGMLGANDPQTRQAITQAVGDALAASMRGQRLLSSA